MLRGFLSAIWRTTIKKFTKERVQSKSGHLAQMVKRKLFIPLWNQRNSIIHSGSSFCLNREHERLENTLEMCKNQYRELLHHSQYYLVDYTMEHVKALDKMEKYTLPYECSKSMLPIDEEWITSHQ